MLAGAPRTLAAPGLRAVIMETNGLGEDDALVETMTSRGFSPFVYDPLQRTLTPGTTSTNTIFVRSVDEVASLCRSAPKFRVAGGTI